MPGVEQATATGAAVAPWRRWRRDRVCRETNIMAVIKKKTKPQQNGSDDNVDDNTTAIPSSDFAALAQAASSLTSSLTRLRQRQRRRELPLPMYVLQHCQTYAAPIMSSVIWSLFSTLLLYGVLSQGWRFWYTSHAWLVIPTGVLFSLTKMRVFMLFHDCGHESYVSSRRWNKILGTLLGAIIYTPFRSWSYAHRIHHRYSNNYDHSQEFAQSAPWTVQMYNEATPRQQWYYTLVFGPLTHFTIVPVVAMLLLQRVACRWYENVLALMVALLWWWWGYDAIVYEVLAATLTASFGYILFHIQHTFEGSYKAGDGEWSFYENAMLGSSFLQVPRYLRWFTCGIEYHHIHHLNTRIPSYRLGQCHTTAVQECCGEDHQHCPWRAEEEYDVLCTVAAGNDHGDECGDERGDERGDDDDGSSIVDGEMRKRGQQEQRQRQRQRQGQGQGQKGETYEKEPSSISWSIPHQHHLFDKVAHVTMRQLWQSFSYSLWDEMTCQYVSVYDQ